MEQQLSLFDSEATLAPRPYEVSLLEVARKISHQFWASQSPTVKQLRSWMTQAFGGSDAEGRWSWKDVGEAQEAAFVLLSKERSKSLLQGSATDVLSRLALVESLGRTHAQRSEESVALQQFSTPPQLAYLVVECARIRATDIVLEPSAGTGILAILAQTRGATVILNELSERRRAILGKLFPGQTAYSFNGERIHDYLPQEIRPTVVVMNPPFSASPNVRRRRSTALSQHVRSAFGRLAPGGRLVLISARWFSPGKPEWESAFGGLSDVRVSLAAAVDGAAYAKHGTSMETRLTVIDKTVPPAGNPPVELHLHFGLSPHQTVRSFRPQEVERLFAALPQRSEEPAVKPESDKREIDPQAGQDGAEELQNPSAQDRLPPQSNHPPLETLPLWKSRRAPAPVGELKGASPPEPKRQGTSVPQPESELASERDRGISASEREVASPLDPDVTAVSAPKRETELEREPERGQKETSTSAREAVRDNPSASEPKRPETSAPKLETEPKREETSPPRPSSPSATQLAVALELTLEPEVVSEPKRESTSSPQTLRGIGRGDEETGGEGEEETWGGEDNSQLSGDGETGRRRDGEKIPNSEFRIPNSEFRIPNPEPLTYDLVERTAPPLGETLYEVYQPQRIRIAGARPHPTTLCESAALASVKPPAVTYAPHLPRAVVETGQLSEAQLESVVYAGEAHSQQLRGFFQVSESFDNVEVTSSDAPEAVRFRRGWFLGDGTGAGKGRQLAGILLDNWCRGRQKALWLSKSDKLLEDARRDWSALGGDPTDIVPLSRYKLGEAISLRAGIIFTTYATLRGQRPGKKSRLQQLLDWLGKDFDGVIAFDESHALGNAIAEAGIRGSTGASQQGLAGLRLQNALPQARILYVSATGATKVMNLAYATRLGLWQTGDFPFANRSEFIHAIEAGGVAAMEVVARDLKALGLYVARNLSFDGVEYEALEVPLTPEQIAIYDAYAEAFQVIHTHLENALEACNIVGSDGKTQNRQAKMAAKSTFESHKQRFFNHLITAMKCPALRRSIEEDLKNGYAAIVQLVSTSESLMKRRLAQIPVEEWNDLNLDITPREYVLDYLACAFPIHLYETYTTDSGELLARQVQDAEGHPVVSQEALALRDELVERLASLPPLPGALDQLLHHFGHEAIAEVTGRSQRILCEKETGRQYVSHRPASANWEEAQAFMDGEKLILIFSDAGGTGRSYHADLCCHNTKRRIHYLLESGWRADNAVQGLGRSHRTHQASAPIFRPVVTDVKGEKRFISTISRRLDALGALTRGSRQTGGQGLFDPKDNLESAYAEAALKQFFSLLYRGQMKVCTLARFETATGLSLATREGALKQELPSISQFLNRILALPIQLQNDLFEVFEILLEAKVEAAMAMGTYETGVETLRAERLTVKSRETVYTHPTGSETVCVEIEKLERHPILTSEAALALSRDRDGVLLVNERSGRAAVKIPTTSTANAEGAIVPRVALVRPGGRVKLLVSELENTTWRAAPRRQWQPLWDAEVANAPEFLSSRLFLISGLLLPIWNSLDADNLRVFRLQTDTGERLLGRVIEPDAMPAIAQALGLRQVKLAPAEIFEQVMAKRQRYQLSGGLSLKASAVMNEVRLEVVGSHISDGLCEQLKAVGCFTEIIQYRRRVFVPANAQLGTVVIEKVLELLH